MNHLKSSNEVCLTVEKLDLVFGHKSERAFQAIDQGKTREIIHQETGQLVGVQGATFEVRFGEIFVLMGLSGSGKSSLLRCINGMNGRGIGNIRGEIFYRDSPVGKVTSILRCPERELREMRRYGISMVFQQFGLMPWRTVWENIEYPLEIQNVPKNQRKEMIEEKLELVGLTAFRDRYPDEISGGMQQRVGLARAFVTQAKLLLMDEPFSALDPLHRKHLQDEILILQEKLKKTIVFVTHDFSEAARLASRMAVMESGKVLQIGSPDEIFEKPACAKVQKFTAAISNPVLSSVNFRELN